MKKLIYVLVLAVIALAANGQSGDAKAVLDKMSSTYKAMAGFEISFVQKNFSEAEVIARTAGSASVAKEKFVLRIEGQQIYCNGPVLWTYLVESQELTISNFEPEEGAINPANIYDIYKEGFTYEYKRQDNVNGELVDVVELISTDEDADFTNIVMYIGQEDAYLKAWDLIDYDGAKTNFEVSAFKPNQVFDAKYFEFDEEANPVQHKEDLRNE
ncbi:hypothetical protein BFP97_02680 [Roseivirga sp. 4D4]|uniref:LolA family protein n=1 Tax=Roseivirga sp. 4D4 TaxID=1889784 RepID=UPI000853941A|nr:outer membrane lipoprotein carrier protein LolA [Roseivirga sp. 4D4]OEK00483.1 hypothetical protein BFP97_02680 [Roseivirga sp. 4D4]